MRRSDLIVSFALGNDERQIFFTGAYGPEGGERERESKSHY